VHEMGLVSGVSRLMKEEMFPAAERGLDNCWSSDSSTLQANVVEPIDPNAQSALCVTYRRSRKSFVHLSMLWLLNIGA
jgi:hypothetical protein